MHRRRLLRAWLPFQFLFLVAVSAQADPRHIYLTYSGAPEISIDVNIILEGKTDAVHVFYDAEPRHEERSAYRHVLEARYVPTAMELSDGRALYVASLTDLAPGTAYSFVAGEGVYGFSRELKFRTLPGGDAPVRFIDGGDMGMDTRAKSILRVAAKQDPDFAVIGGDLAYANGLIGNTALWDAWLDNWTTYMRRSDGCMVPLVTCIGNHEVNKYATDDPELRSPWYIPLFGRQGEALYYTREVGDNIVFFVLDSGYHNPFDGAQAAWLKGELEKHKNAAHKFAVYHMPLYPAFSGYGGARQQLARKAWGTLFDEYGLQVAFEHDDHVAKRSKPLRGGQVAEGGTVYVGDGAFGRESRNVGRELRWYDAMEESTVHFWLVDVAEDGVTLQAIDRKEQVFDSLSLP